MIPTVDGIPIFGVFCQCTTTDNPRNGDPGSYFGQNYLEGNIGSGPNRTTTIHGTASGHTAAGLVLSEANLRNLNDGRSHTITDSLGTTWDSVLIGPYQPTGRVRQTPGGFYFRTFEIRLTHLR